MSELWDGLIGPFIEFGFMRRALAGCLALSLGAAPVGVFLMLRRMSLTGDAMAHAILPGAAIAYLIAGLSLPAMTLGGIISGLLVAAASTLVARSGRQSEDSSLAAFYLMSLSLGVVIVSTYGNQVDLLHVLFGSVLALDDDTLLLIGVIASVSLLGLAVLYRPLVFECVDANLLPRKSPWGSIAHFGFMGLLVINLVAGFHALGTLMSIGLLVLPAASAPSGQQASGSHRGGEPWEPEAWEPEPQALPEPVAQDAPRSGAHALDPTPQQDASVPVVLGPEMVPTPQPDAPAHRPWSPSAPSAVDSMAAPTDPAAAVDPSGSGDLPQRPVEPFDSPTDLAEASIDVLGQAPARPVPVVIGLGGNVGTVVIALRTAVATLRNTPGITVTQVAPLARSAAVLEEGSPSQPDFLNTVVLADTTLSPRDLLQVCHQLEDAAGRLRTEPKGPRTLDADIITYGEMTSDDPELTIPHPLAAQRAFVLAPWAEADPFGEINGQSVAALADVAPDRDGLRWLALDWLESDHLPALPTGQYVAPPTDSAEQAPEEPAPGAGHPLPEAAPQDAGAQEAWQEEPAAPAEPWSTSASLPPVAPHSSRSARSARSARSPRSAHSAELAPGAEPVPADGSGAPGAAGVAEAAPQGRAQERRDGIGSLFPDSRSGSWSEPLGWNDVLGRDGRSS